jgi:hypothetical protein
VEGQFAPNDRNGRYDQPVITAAGGHLNWQPWFTMIHDASRPFSVGRATAQLGIAIGRPMLF